MPLELVPLCTATVTLGETVHVSPSLVIGELVGVEVEGERIRATQRGRTAADWLQVSPQGFGVVDVRVTLETHDGAIVHAAYNGRLLFESMTAYVTPSFHTGDLRYQWLNSIQAVAKGTFPAPDTLVYEMYALR
jgi:hypothetical protein